MMATYSTDKSDKAQQSQLAIAYVFFIASAGAAWYLVADGAFSSILTLSVMVHCLAVVLLGLQMIYAGSASGISAKALQLDALGLCCRLSSTLWLNGYLPVDASGDYVFQAFDLCSLAMLAWLLHRHYVANKGTFQSPD